MKLSQEQTVSIDAPLIKKAQEMVNGLILEYGIFIELQLDTTVEYFSFLDSSGYQVQLPSQLVTGIHFQVMDHVFENIKDLRKALELKAFL